MSSITGIVLIGIGCYAAIYYNAATEKRLQKQIEEKIKEDFEKKKKIFEKIMKDSEKRIYINNFIDEIPELSYYEAKQLQKKLGNIYLEWNDE